MTTAVNTNFEPTISPGGDWEGSQKRQRILALLVRKTDLWQVGRQGKGEGQQVCHRHRGFHPSKDEDGRRDENEVMEQLSFCLYELFLYQWKHRCTSRALLSPPKHLAVVGLRLVSPSPCLSDDHLVEGHIAYLQAAAAAFFQLSFPPGREVIGEPGKVGPFGIVAEEQTV